MADSVIDIVQNLTYNADVDVIEALNAEFGAQLKQLQDLTLKQQRYQQLLDKTGSDNVKQQRVLQALLARTKSQYDSVTSSIAKQVDGSQRLTKSVNQLAVNTNGVGVAFANIVRDAPFGIIGIGNNITQVFDAGSTAFKQFREQGLSTGQAFARIGASFLSLNTALSVGVTLLTVMATQFGKTSKSAKEATTSIDEAAKALDNYSKINTTVADANDEGVNALKREADAIKAKGVIEGNVLDAERRNFEAEQAIRKQEQKDLNERIKLYKRVEVTLKRTGRGSNEQIQRRFAQSVSGFPAPDREALTKAFNEGTLTRRSLNEKILQLNEEAKNKANEITQEEVAFNAQIREKEYNLRVALIQRTNELEVEYAKLRLNRGVETFNKIQQLNEIELNENERLLNEEIEQQRKAGALSIANLKKYEEIRLQLRITANEKLIQENLDFFNKEKEELETIVAALGSIFADKAQEPLKKISTGLDSVSDHIQRRIKKENNLQKERVKAAEEAYDAIRNAAFTTAQQIYDFQLMMADREIALYQNRVNTAIALAERGNTELLRIEQERLDKAQQERERIGQKQIQLNNLITISEQAKNVAAAIGAVIQSAKGDPYLLAFRVIAAAAAIGAAIGTVSSAVRAQNAGFMDGGYTGNIAPNQEAGVVHGREFVFDAPTTAKFKPQFEAIHKGVDPYIAFASPKFSSGKIDFTDTNKRLDRVAEAVEASYVNNNVHLNERGVYSITEKQMRLNKRRFGR